MITMREYWQERVREQVLAAARSGELPAEVHNNVKDFGASIDSHFEQVVDYPKDHEERQFNAMMVKRAGALLRNLGIIIDQTMKQPHIIWPDRERAESLQREIIRALNGFWSTNWEPAAATIRYAAPLHNHAEVVGVAPYFREEIHFEGIEYKGGQPVMPIPSHQTLVTLCGYLDRWPGELPDLVVTRLVGFTSTEDGSCMALESLVTSMSVSGMSPSAAMDREVQKAMKSSKKVMIESARSELFIPMGSVH